MNVRTWSAAAGIVIASSAGVTGCGAHVDAPRTATADTTYWNDLLGTDDGMSIVLSPKKIAADPVYGAALQKALEDEASQPAMAANAPFLAAIEDADAVVVAVHSDNACMLVVHGLPSSLDPSRLRDSNGAAALVQVASSTQATEYASARGWSDKMWSLFALRDGTWVLATGRDVGRLRLAFARGDVPALHVDTTLPVAFRVSGAFLRTTKPCEKDCSTAYEGLAWCSGGLTSSAERTVEADCAYDSSDAAAHAEAWDRERRQKDLASDDSKVFVARAIAAALIESEDVHRDGKTLHASVRFHRWIFDWAASALKRGRVDV